MESIIILILSIGCTILAFWELYVYKRDSQNKNEENNIIKKRFYRRSKMIILLLSSLALIQFQEIIPNFKGSPFIKLFSLLLGLSLIVFVCILVLKDLKEIGISALENQKKLRIESLKNIQSFLKDLDKDKK